MFLLTKNQCCKTRFVCRFITKFLVFFVTIRVATDGKIAGASLYGIQKRYENEKYYVYIVSILRENSTVPSFIFRRYSEFSELNQKLAILYPQARTLNLRSGPLVGRTHVKQVAEKRKNELDVFLRHLFSMPAEISLCDLVYTFFHPSLRDEKDAHLAHKSVKLKSKLSDFLLFISVTRGPILFILSKSF